MASSTSTWLKYNGMAKFAAASCTNLEWLVAAFQKRIENWTE